ncbi:hypothetical protein O181_043503 [Austropuccinia psidii MF-1]|uniref:Uncharacterized protein n=1 Tax=Austropuccinia psidii MF-1 TaxID=1389203 RepID=A0A9Q3DN97_9BASI|nr:hypothetical protein [Austropuccinia psidii MF-1]
MPTLMHELASGPPDNHLLQLPILTNIERYALPSCLGISAITHSCTSTAYLYWAPTHPSNYIPTSSLHPHNDWFLHQCLIIFTIDHPYTDPHICFLHTNSAYLLYTDLMLPHPHPISCTHMIPQHHLCILTLCICAPT